MEFRNYQPGDETIQADIYNEAAAKLPRFVPAKMGDILRRVQDKGFAPETRIFAVDQGRPVAYIAWQTNGRVGYPWCRAGSETHRDELLSRALQALKNHGVNNALAANRADWSDVNRFYLVHGFKHRCEFINFAVELNDMRLPSVPDQPVMAPLRESDIPGIRALAPELLRVGSDDELSRHFFQNPYFGPESVFIYRDQDDRRRVGGVGIVIEKAPYADPRNVDANMPCFRLGAFGTEGMTHKRINGLFSLLVPDLWSVGRIEDVLLVHGVQLLRSANITVIAAQAPSDMPHLVAFYDKYFHRQGAFPILERPLT